MEVGLVHNVHERLFLTHTRIMLFHTRSYILTLANFVHEGVIHNPRAYYVVSRAQNLTACVQREREQHLLIGASICTLELAPSSSLSSPELRSLRARVIVLTIVGGHLCFPLSAYDWTVWPITRPHFFFFLIVHLWSKYKMSTMRVSNPDLWIEGPCRYLSSH